MARVSRTGAPTGPFRVGGDGRKLPTSGCAFSLAISRATNADGEFQVGVYRDSEQIGRVVKLQDGVIEIHSMNGRRS